MTLFHLARVGRSSDPAMINAECWHTKAKLRTPRPRKNVLGWKVAWERISVMPPAFSTDVAIGL